MLTVHLIVDVSAFAGNDVSLQLGELGPMVCSSSKNYCTHGSTSPRFYKSLAALESRHPANAYRYLISSLKPTRGSVTFSSLIKMISADHTPPLPG